jgi:Glucose / Sorbosone dehydrogenase
MRRLALFCCCIVWLVGVRAAAAATTVIPGFRERVVLSGLDGPTAFAFLPDGRVIVAQKDGRLFLVAEGRPVTSALLTLQPSEENERGVSGVTVDPGFAQNGYIYVYYTTSAQSCFGPTCDQAARAAAQSQAYPGPKNRVSRFALAGDAIDPDSETVILDGIPSDSGSHNAGCMAFGPDGYLYVTTGDGGEVAAHAQDLDSLSGKVLRIAADGSIPADNPYVGIPGARGEVWSLGFRNPWKFTFDERGRLLVGDVGENDWEEVDIVTRGGNYGWPWFEGPELTDAGREALGDGADAALLASSNVPATFNSRRPPRRSRVAEMRYLPPAYTYPHNGLSEAIILGAAPGSQSNYPDIYRQRLFFADLIQQHVWSISFDGDGTPALQPFADGVGLTTQLKGGPDGNVWFVSFSRGVLARFEVDSASAPASVR